MTNDRKNQSGLFIHSGGKVSYYYFRDEVVRRVSLGQNDYLYFMPVNRAVRRLKRQLVDEAPGQALIDPPVFTFDDFLLRLYNLLPRPRKVLQPEVVLFFIEDILQKEAPEFGYLLPDKTVTPGLVKKTADMVAEFRRFGYDSEKFDAKADEAPQVERQKYHDFKMLITRLEDRFGDDFIDEPFARHRASLMLNKELFESCFPAVKEIFINGYGLFTPAMYLFIEKTAQWLPVHIKLEYCADNPALFQQTAEAAERFKEMGAQFRQEEKHSLLARRLFNREEIVSASSLPAQSYIIRGLTNRREETEYIARRILDLHRREAAPLHRIAVTFPNLEKYIPILRRTFEAYGIPYNLSTGLRLHQSPLIRTFLRCLQVVESRFEYRKTLELLNSPFLRLQGKINLDRLHRKLIEQRMRYLSPGWAERLLHTLPDKERDEWAEPLRLINEKLKPLYQTPSVFKAADFRVYFIALLQELGLLEWYVLDNRYLTERQRENEFRAFNRFMKQFERFIWALRHTDPQADYSLSEINAKLSASLGRMDYNLTEWPEYGVQIMPRLEIQAIEYRWLFLGGLVDGEFPRASGHDVFFNDKTRQQLGLLASEELLHQDRFIFYSLLESGAREITLTFPRYEEDRAVVPSTFVSELSELCAITPDTGPFENEADLPAERKWQKLGLAIQNNRFDTARQAAAAIMDENSGEKEHLLSVLRRVRTSRLRIVGDSFSVYEGNLGGQSEVLPFIREQFAQSVWSVSKLEEYAFCPMQFFLHRLLNTEELPLMEDGLSGLERGNAVHKILFRFYTLLREKKAEERPADYRDELINIAKEVFNDLPLKGFFKNLEFMQWVGSPPRPGNLLRLLDYDQKAIAEKGYRPAYLEWSFGYSGDREQDPASTKEALRLSHTKGRLRLNGSIDRIDLDENGNAVIIDYKTGFSAAKESVRTIMEGLHFQLPLYALAFQQFFHEQRVVWAGYYLLADAEKIRRHPLIADSAVFPSKNSQQIFALPNETFKNENDEPYSFQDMLEATLERALDLVASLKDGYFALGRYPDSPACQSYCDYKRMCQKNVAKMKRVGGLPIP